MYTHTQFRRETNLFRDNYLGFTVILTVSLTTPCPTSARRLLSPSFLNYCAQNALILPGRVPGFQKTDIRFPNGQYGRDRWLLQVVETADSISCDYKAND